jgi:hypothetical protein
MGAKLEKSMRFCRVRHYQAPIHVAALGVRSRSHLSGLTPVANRMPP